MFGAGGLSQLLPVVPLFLTVSFFLALICISRVFLFVFLLHVLCHFLISYIGGKAGLFDF